MSNLPIEKFSYLWKTFVLRVLEVETYNTEARRCAIIIESACNQTHREDNGFNVSAPIFKSTRKYTEYNIVSFISVFNQLDAQNLFHNKFYFMPLHVSSTCARNM